VVVQTTSLISSTHVGRIALSIPAVTRIVSHFIRHVLAKTKFVWIHTNLRQKQIYPRHEIAQSLICYQTLK